MPDFGELEKVDTYNFKTQKRRVEVYRTTCSCACDEHDITLYLEEEDDIISLEFISRLECWNPYDKPYWWKYEGNTFEKIKDYLDDLWYYYRNHYLWRLKYAWKILINDHVKLEGYFTARDENQLMAISNVISNFVKERKNND